MATIIGTVQNARKARLIFRQYPEGITGQRFVPNVESMRQWPIILGNRIKTIRLTLITSTTMVKGLDKAKTEVSERP